MLLCFAFFGVARAEVVEVGDGGTTNNSYLPGYNYYNYSLTQQIYTPCEIGMAGTINSIAFKNTGAEKTRTYNVYMLLTDKETFTGGTDWVAMSDDDLVFEGAVTFTVDEWTTITLDTPFDFDGVNNLLVGVADVSGGYSSSPHMACLVFEASSQAIRAYRDASAYDITNPNVTGSVLNVKNQIQLNITPDPSVVLCCPPRTFVADNIEFNRAHFSWEGGTGDYNLEYKKASEDEWHSMSTDANAMWVEDLDPETAYDARIQSNCSEGNVSDWKTLSFTTLEACPTPTGLSVTANGQSATFTWTSDASSFDVAYATDGTANPDDLTYTTVNINSYTKDNLAIDLDHYFWVRAHCDDLNSAWAGPASVHIGYCVPNPTSHDGSGITGVTFGIGDYIVENGGEGSSIPATAPYYGDYTDMIGAVQAGVESTIAITTATGSYPYTFVIWVDFDNSLSFEDAEIVYIGKCSSGVGTLEANITVPADQATGDYRMRIYGADSYFNNFYNYGNTNWDANHDPCNSGTYRHANDYTLRVLEAPSCLTPTGLAASDVTAHEATITWTSNAEAWQVQLDDEDPIDVTEAIYTFASLAPETTFNVKVRANCDGIYSEWTNAVSFTTTIACPVPTAVTVSNIAARTAEVSWTSDASNFVVAYKLDIREISDWTEVNVTTNSYTLTDLIPESSYKVRVKAVCGGIDGESEWTGISSFTTDVACPAPTNLVIDNITAHGATISWTGSNDSFVVEHGVYDYDGTPIPTTLLEETFDDSAMPTGWSITGLGTGNWSVSASSNAGGSANELRLNWTPQFNGISRLVIPAIDLTGQTSVTFEFKHYLNNYSGSHTLGIATSSDNGTTWNEGWSQSYNITGTYTVSEEISTSDMGKANVQFCIYYSGNSYNINNWYFDDVNISGVEYPVVWTNDGSVANVNNTGSYTFTTLTPETNYLVRVTGMCDGELSDPSDVLSFTTIASCAMPTNLAVTTDGATATATWEGTASTYNIDINGTVIEDATSPYTFDVELTTTYVVMVQASCTGETSDWTDAYSFTTPACVGGHHIEYVLTDSYGDGWNGNAINISDACGIVETITLADGSSGSGSIDLCSDYYRFTWKTGNYASETSFTLIDNGVTLYSGQGGGSLTNGQVLYTIGTAPTMLLKPTDLTAGDPEAYQVELSWTENGEATAWEICVNDDEENLIAADNNPFTLDQLTPDTDYIVKVRATNGTNVSCWSDVTSFHTAEACPKPTNVTASNITAHSADIAWTGNDDVTSYNLRYAIAPEGDFFDDFENGLDQWTLIVNAEGTGWQTFDASQFQGGSNYNGNYVAMARSYEGGNDITADNWMITHQITIGSSMTYWARNDNRTDHLYDETYDVCVSTSSNNPEDFVIVQTFTTTPNEWEQITIDLSAYAGQQGYVAFHHHDSAKDMLLIDDVTITAPSTEIEWTTVNDVTNPYTLTELTGNTTYEVQVMAVCGGEDESAWVGTTFTTLDPCTVPSELMSSDVTCIQATLSWTGFQESYNVHYRTAARAGEWNIVTANTTTLDLTDLVPETIYEWKVQGVDCDGEGNDTEWSEIATFTTLDGQVFTKDITGYGTGTGNWYLIATPIDSITPAHVTNMVANPEEEYDLFVWDGTTDETDDDGNLLVWRNFKTGEFTQLEPGKGYLYANKNTVTLTFAGTPYDGEGSFDLTYDAEQEEACLNLVGNPYAVTATLDANHSSFYTLNSDGDKFKAVTSNTIEAMEGIFVVATSEGDQVTFIPDESGDKNANLALNLSSGSNLVDRAIVRFDGGTQLPKYQLNPNDTKVYIQQEGKDYAVVNASEMGEIPVSFKAESNGSYTLSFIAEEVSFNYLHLIDNMTGADVDLLVNPSYSFDANTTDYASRFKLVFATGSNSDDNFAFFSNGSFVISNEGEATLQVVDVTGRILNSETINGSASIHVDAAPGVYMLRLINGDNVKVQKVVVR